MNRPILIPDWAPAERQGAHPEPDPGAADSGQVVPIHQRQEVPAQLEGHRRQRQLRDHDAADAKQKSDRNPQNSSGRISGFEKKH